MKPHRLAEGEFKTTFATRMDDVTKDPGEAIDIWPYVAAVPAEDLGEHVVWDQYIEHVYRGSDGRYDHVLVMTKTRDTYLVIVVDRREMTIHGHCLLDLPNEYGLDN